MCKNFHAKIHLHLVYSRLQNGLSNTYMLKGRASNIVRQINLHLVKLNELIELQLVYSCLAKFSLTTVIGETHFQKKTDRRLFIAIK